jgi:hypothetical protein
MSVLKERKDAQEAKYSSDLDNSFKISVVRNKLLAHWVANKRELDADDTTRYTQEVVASDIASSGQKNLITKILTDITKFDLDISEKQLREKLTEFESQAKEKVQNNVIKMQP